MGHRAWGIVILILYEDAFNFFNVDAQRLAAGYRQERQERQAKSLREFGAASLRNGISLEFKASLMEFKASLMEFKDSLMEFKASLMRFNDE